MDQTIFRSLLEQVRSGEVAVDQALERLRHLPFEDLGFAKVDHHRAMRHGMPEVILGKGKTPEQILRIAQALLAKSQNVLVTRASAEAAELLMKTEPEGEHFPLSGIVRFWRDRTKLGKGRISVICAGTSDLPVMEEAQLTAETMGN